MKTILVIDDDPVDAFVTENILRHVGFPIKLLRAIHGIEARTMLEQLRHKSQANPDIILVDLHMPMMNGFEFLEAFAALELPGKETIRVIVLTLTHDSEGVQRALSLGAEAVLFKPLQLDQLRKVLARN